MDMSHYSGPYLPGFSPVTTVTQQQLQSDQSMIHRIDHVAFAMPLNSAMHTIAWYERVLGLQRFVINE